MSMRVVQISIVMKFQHISKPMEMYEYFYIQLYDKVMPMMDETTNKRQITT